MAAATAERVEVTAHVASEKAPLVRLQCIAQNYAWGRPAERSEVASLCAAAGGKIAPTERYAELWMGTHPSGPSYVKGTGQTLRDWLAENPGALGDKVGRCASGPVSELRFPPARIYGFRRDYLY